MPTIGFTSARTITAHANPPRSVFLDLPLGHTTGLPHDQPGQRTILTEGLEAAHAMAAPGIVDLPYRYVDDDWKGSPLSWSRRRQNAGSTSGSAGDTRNGRSDEPQYQSENDRQAANAVDWDAQCEVCIGIAG
ncbi:MAG: hypothetical protein AAF467_18650 [Actinomycetota bacterium]